MVNVKALSICLIITGVVLLVGGFVARFFILDALSKGVSDGVTISSDTSSSRYSDWLTNRRDDAPATYYAYSIYNITNIAAVLKGAVPTVQLAGPYVYRQYSTKFNVEFQEDDEYVKYEELTQKEYQADLTTGGFNALTDQVYVFNKNYWALYGSSIVGASDQKAFAGLCTPFFNYYMSDLQTKMGGTLNDAYWMWGNQDTDPLLPQIGFFKAFQFSFKSTTGVPLTENTTISTIIKGPNGDGTCFQPFNASATNPLFMNVNLCGLACAQTAPGGPRFCGASPANSALYPLQAIALILNLAAENPTDQNLVVGKVCGAYFGASCSVPAVQQLTAALIYNYIVPFQNTTKLTVQQDPGGGTLCRPTTLAALGLQGVGLTIPGAMSHFAATQETGSKELFAETNVASLKWRKMTPNDFIVGQADSPLMAKVVNLVPVPGTLSSKTIIALKRIGTFRNFLTQGQQDPLDEFYIVGTGKNADTTDQLTAWEGLTNLASSTGGVWPAFSAANPFPSVGANGKPAFGHYNMQLKPGFFNKDKFKFENAITDKGLTLSLFNDETTRIIPLEFREEVDVKGVNTYKYGLGASLLAVNPLFQQELEGIGNFSGRTLGFTVLITKPHFLGADTTGLEARYTTLAGYKASSDSDDSFINVDPVTGAQLGGSLKLQQNFVAVQSGTGVSTFTSEQPITSTVIPSTIIHKYGELTDKQSSDYKDKIGRALLAADVMVYVLTIVGFLMMVGGIVALIVHLKRGGGYNTQTSQENLSS